MRTIDEQFTRDENRLSRWRRDAGLLLRIITMLLTYFTDGRRIRRAYRRAESRGETYWVDEELGS